MDLKQTGRLIAQARKARGLTQQELAEQIGVTDKAVSRWETGRGFPEVSVLQGLSEALGVSITDLVRGETAPEEDVREQADRAVLEALSYSAQVVRRVVGLLLLFAGGVLALLPLGLVGGGMWRWALAVWGAGLMGVGACLYSRRVWQWLQRLSRRALGGVSLAALAAALALEAAPWGVAMRWMPRPGEERFTLHAYFSLLPLGYGNVFPLVTGVCTLAAALRTGAFLVRPPRTAGHRRWSAALWIGFFASLAAQLFLGPACVTPAGAGISLLLLAAALLQVWAARPTGPRSSP